jgi:uncharacterized protein (TIRG00374 family)
MTTASRPTWLRWGLIIAGLAVAGAFVWLIVRTVDPAAVGRAVAAADPSLLALGLLPLAAGYACRIVRWYLLLLPANSRLGLRSCVAPLLGGFALNNVLPARAGDVVRIVAFQERLGTGAAATAGSVMIERILDLMVLIACLMVGLALVPNDRVPVGIRMIGGVGGWSILAGGTLVLVGAGWLRPWCERFAERSTGLPQRLAGLVGRVLLGMDLIRDRRRLALVAALSLLVWIGELGLYLCVERSLASGAGAAGAVLGMAAGNLATLIPGTPGHVGTFHYFVTAAFAAAGSSQETAVACAVLIHLLFWISTTLAGLIALAVTGWWRQRPETP